MLRLWKWYQNCLAVHPVKTQVISSGLIWGAGDIAAQAVTNYTAKTHITMDEDKKKEFKINWKRVSTTSLFGLGFVGPVGHYWGKSFTMDSGYTRSPTSVDPLQ